MTVPELREGQVAVVVGAGGGLGHATALKLASQGMKVVAVDRNELNLEGLPEGIVREVVDATDPDSVTPMIERIAHDVGTPDVLVNTLGAFEMGDAMTTTPELLRRMMDVNLGASLTKKEITPAIASGVTACDSMSAGRSARFLAVAISWGATAFTRMPRGRSSRSRTRIKWTREALL